MLKAYRSVLLSILFSLPILTFGVLLKQYDALPSWARSMLARILDTHEDVLSPIASTVAPLFMLLAVTLQMVVAGLGLSFAFSRTFRTMNETIESLISIVVTIVKTGPLQVAHQELDELKATLQTQVREAEARLRGEWRFVAGVVIAVVLAAFLGALATR